MHSEDKILSGLFCDFQIYLGSNLFLNVEIHNAEVWFNKKKNLLQPPEGLQCDSPELLSLPLGGSVGAYLMLETC